MFLWHSIGLGDLSLSQTITKFQRNISQHCWLQHIARVWSLCLVTLFENGQIFHATLILWMLHDVVCVWTDSSMLLPGMYTNSIFNTEHVATRRNRMTKLVRHVAPNNVAICCVHMLWSFSLSLQMLGQQCRDMLCWNVAIVWPGL